MLAGCASPAPINQTTEYEKPLKVVATTNIVGDVVAQVGGEYIQLSVLLPAGTDPHSFVATPKDLTLVAEADLVFANGAGLEEFLDDLIENAGGESRVVDLSEGIQLQEQRINYENADNDPHEQEDDHAHTSGDPHVWTNPNNVKIWVKNILAASALLIPPMKMHTPPTRLNIKPSWRNWMPGSRIRWWEYRQKTG